MIRRGDIWWASLPSPKGSEPGYSRPVLVVQSNEFNRSKIRTIIAVALTSNLNLADAPGNVLLSRKATGLPRRSVANVSQVITIDKSFLTEKIRSLPGRDCARVDAGLRLVMSV